MKAARVHRFGPPDVIAIDDTERPRPGPGEILVRVEAAGVGPWDGWIRGGKSVLPQPLPLTLGSDLAGTVEELGAGVRGLARGDDVFGVTNARFTEAYAEYAIALAAMIAAKPRRLRYIEAASVPVVAVTAQQMLFDHAHVVRGQRVLIHGAAGNVGAYAVQLARIAGAYVVAAVRGADETAYVRRLGADEVLDTTTSRLEDAVAPVHAVIDTIGGDTQARSFEIVHRGGRLVSAVSEPDQDRAARHGVTAKFILVDVTTAALTRIASLLDEGQLVTRVGTILPLAEAKLAHEMLEGTRPHAPGKIVLAIGPGAT